jgi:hypothetical protein
MKDLPFQVREIGEASSQKPRSILCLEWNSQQAEFRLNGILKRL